MTKGAKKTGGLRRRSQRSTPVRKRSGRTIKQTILIVGEGRETEPNYFRGLRSQETVINKFKVKVLKGSGGQPEQIVEKVIEAKKRAKSRGEDYDEVWCVLDVEGPARRNSLDIAVRMAKQNEITLCLSNPCFEVWLLAHFVRKGRAYNDCDAVIVQLDKYWERHYNQKYRKNDENIYDRLSARTQTAIDNAKWVRENHHRNTENAADCNSSTDVYRLVEHLLGP